MDEKKLVNENSSKNTKSSYQNKNSQEIKKMLLFTATIHFERKEKQREGNQTTSRLL